MIVMFKSTPLPPTRFVFLIIDSYLTHRPSLDMVLPVYNIVTPDFFKQFSIVKKLIQWASNEITAGKKVNFVGLLLSGSQTGQHMDCHDSWPMNRCNYLNGSPFEPHRSQHQSVQFSNCSVYTVMVFPDMNKLKMI